MSLLFEDEYANAPALCFACALVFDRSNASESLKCPECGFSIPEARFREFYRHAFYASRYGIQYRRQIEKSEEPDAKFFLAPLGDLATFVALAVASGVLGNAAWEGVRFAVRRILAQRELCSKHEGYSFTEAEIEQLIEYLSDYEDGFSRLPERVRHDIVEEILGDAAAENPVIADRLGKLLFKQPTPSKAAKRQAMVLYRELARRSAVRARKRPDKPRWRFWDLAGG